MSGMRTRTHRKEKEKDMSKENKIADQELEYMLSLNDEEKAVVAGYANGVIHRIIDSLKNPPHQPDMEKQK